MPSNAAEPGTGDAEPGTGLAELVLHAARDLAKVDTAFDAELLLSTLLGSVYAASPPDRAEALTVFVRVLRRHIAGADGEAARVAGAVLDALSPPDAEPAQKPVPQASPADERRPEPAPQASPADERRPEPAPQASPAWLGEVGAVRVTGGYAYGDRYGDQTSYLLTYAYRDGTTGGPEHVLVILVDHNLGLVKDLLITAPAQVVLDQLRDSVAADREAMTWLAEVEPATVRAASAGYLRATDTAEELPGSESLTANLALARARLAEVAQPDAAPDAAGRVPALDKDALIAEFLAAPEARLSGLAGGAGRAVVRRPGREAADERRETVAYCLGLIIEFADLRGGDPLRWSPRAVEAFLLDWVHGRAVLDVRDAGTLPDALGAWVLWSGRRLSLPEPAVQATFDAVDAARPEFARLHATGERRSPAVRAMAGLLADGVDLDDERAVEDWLRTHPTQP